MAGSGRSHLRRARDVILQVRSLTVEYPLPGTKDAVQAVSDVSFDVAKGETLGVVGESGCGKSTLGRAVVSLVNPKSGQILFNNEEFSKLSNKELLALRPQIQMVFQDPISSLNPYRKIADILAEPFQIKGETDNIDERIHELFEQVGLDPSWADRYPHELSGGQCQRVNIARSLAMNPKVLICDESVSSLDVSVQGQIINLLERLKAEYNLSLVFISHDLAVVKHLSDRIMVMYLGKVCEIADPETMYRTPAHPYTTALLKSVPVPDPTRRGTLDSDPIKGDPPSAINPPSGCRFHPRCPNAQERCTVEEPSVRKIGPDHYVACHFPNVGPEAPAALPTENSYN